MPLKPRILVIAASARVQAEGTALALVLWAAAVDKTTIAAALVAATTFPQLVSGPIMGRTLDRSPYPERWVAGCAMLAATSLLGLTVADLRLWPSLVAAVLLATATPVLTGGLSSLIMGWSDDQSALAAWDGTGYNIAGLAAPALVTATAAWNPSLSPAALAGVTVLSIVPLLRSRTNDPDPAVEGLPERPGILDAARAIGRSRPLAVVTLATTTFSLGLGGLELALVAGVQARGLTPDRAGILATSIAIGALVGSLTLTVVRHQFRAAPMTLTAIVVSALGLLALALVDWPLMVPIAVVIGIADGPLLVGTYRARSEHSPPHSRSGVFTLAASAKLGAGALGAMIVGAMVAAGPTSNGLLLIGAIGIGAASVGTALDRRPATR